MYLMMSFPFPILWNLYKASCNLKKPIVKQSKKSLHFNGIMIVYLSLSNACYRWSNLSDDWTWHFFFFNCTVFTPASLSNTMEDLIKDLDWKLSNFPFYLMSWEKREEKKIRLLNFINTTWETVFNVFLHLLYYAFIHFLM